MIVKEVDIPASKDRFSQAGFKAEEQMAYYFRRAFEDSKDVLVLNGIRLKSDDDSAQIDHLIIHKYGMVIVESKSAVGTIAINERNEWIRSEYNRGMASPVLQGERQASFLKKYLDHSGLEPPHDRFRSLAGMITFSHVPVDVLVAISDTGILKPHPTVNTDVVHKADVVPGKVQQVIDGYRKRDSLWTADLLTPRPLKLSSGLMHEIAKLLKERHVPRKAKGGQQVRQRRAEYSVPTSGMRRVTEKSHVPNSSGRVRAGQHKAKGFVPTPGREGYTCRDCGGYSVCIRWGRNGYYFSCSECDNTMTAKGYCKECGRQSKLSKDRNRFYINCEEHGKGDLFFTSPS